MTLESLAQPAGMAVLKVGLQTNDPALHVEPNWETSLRIEDQNGQNLLLSPTSLFDQDGFDAVTFETPILVPGKQYTLILQGPIEVFKNVSAEDTSNQFTLDLGLNPQPGQSWELDQTLEAAGQAFHLNGAHLLAGNVCGLSNSTEGGTVSLVFDFDPHPGVTDLMVGPLDVAPKASRVYQGACIVYPETPSGLLEFKIDNVNFQVEGSWEIIWQVPAQ